MNDLAKRLEEAYGRSKRQTYTMGEYWDLVKEAKVRIEELEKYKAWVESTAVGKSMSRMEAKLKLADEALAEIQEKLADNEVALDIQGAWIIARHMRKQLQEE